MSFVDKSDFKTGFWLGLGFLLALFAIGVARFSFALLGRRRHGG